MKKYIKLTEEQKKDLMVHIDACPELNLYDPWRKFVHMAAEKFDNDVMENILTIAKEKGYTDVIMYNKHEIARALANYKPESVVEGQSVAPYCPRCMSGEWMTNEDGSHNAFCGQCGQALNWEKIVSEDEE